MTSKKNKEEKPKFLKLPTGPGPDAQLLYYRTFGKRIPRFTYMSIPPRQLLEIVNSACESGKEVEDWGVYFQDE